MLYGAICRLSMVLWIALMIVGELVGILGLFAFLFGLVTQNPGLMVVAFLAVLCYPVAWAVATLQFWIITGYRNPCEAARDEAWPYR